MLCEHRPPSHSGPADPRYVTRSADEYNGTFLFENNIVADNGKNGINFDGTPGGGAIMRFNTLYFNGAFDSIQADHIGPNKVSGIAAKHVGFMTIANNIIVCRNDSYSALSVWDASPTTTNGNLILNCAVNLRTPAVGTVTMDPKFVAPSTDLGVADFSLSPGLILKGA